MCGHALARAHARSGDSVMIAGYLGTSKSFDQAIGEFAVQYAEQNSLDYQAFIESIRQGKIQAQRDA
jgi:predicted alpha/beta hydrolase